MTLPLVLLNGWGMTRSVWTPLMAALSERRSMHAMDLHELGDGRLQDLAHAAAARAPAACDVLGWSLGAQVALQWAHDRPAQVRRVVLIAATPRFVAQPDGPAGMEPAVFEAFAAQVAADATAALARFALLQARGDANTSAVARVLRAALAREGRASPQALEAGLAGLRDNDLRAVSRNVGQPVYLVHGAEDAIVPPAAAAWLQQTLPAARLSVLPGAGHAPQVSQAAAVGTSIAEFLDEH